MQGDYVLKLLSSLVFPLSNRGEFQPANRENGRSTIFGLLLTFFPSELRAQRSEDDDDHISELTGFFALTRGSSRIEHHFYPAFPSTHNQALENQDRFGKIVSIFRRTWK